MSSERFIKINELKSNLTRFTFINNVPKSNMEAYLYHDQIYFYINDTLYFVRYHPHYKSFLISKNGIFHKTFDCSENKDIVKTIYNYNWGNYFDIDSSSSDSDE